MVQGTPKGYIMTSLAERETLQKLQATGAQIRNHTSDESIYCLVTEENRVKNLQNKYFGA